MGNRRLAGWAQYREGVGTMHNIWNVTSHNIGRGAPSPPPLNSCFTLFTEQGKVSEVTKAQPSHLPADQKPHIVSGTSVVAIDVEVELVDVRCRRSALLLSPVCTVVLV